MSAIKESAFAKINLYLHVLGRRADGYHLLDGVVMFADICDTVTLMPSTKDQITVDGPFADPALENWSDNLIGKAIDSFRHHIASTPPLHIHLSKTLPIAAGLGGGSANAAATLHGLYQLTAKTPTPLDLKKIAALGADVPMCFMHKPCQIAGIGDDITPLSFLPDFYIVLVNPRTAVSTKAVYDKLRQQQLSPHKTTAPAFTDYPSMIDFLKMQQNDLAPIAQQLNPDIEKILTVLKKTNADLVRMAGSGPTCFGLFKTKEQATAATEKISTAHPQWWIKVAKVLT